MYTSDLYEYIGTGLGDAEESKLRTSVANVGWSAADTTQEAFEVYNYNKDTAESHKSILNNCFQSNAVAHPTLFETPECQTEAFSGRRDEVFYNLATRYCLNPDREKYGKILLTRRGALGVTAPAECEDDVIGNNPDGFPNDCDEESFAYRTSAAFAKATKVSTTPYTPKSLLDYPILYSEMCVGIIKDALSLPGTESAKIRQNTTESLDYFCQNKKAPYYPLLVSSGSNFLPISETAFDISSSLTKNKVSSDFERRVSRPHAYIFSLISYTKIPEGSTTKNYVSERPSVLAIRVEERPIVETSSASSQIVRCPPCCCVTVDSNSDRIKSFNKAASYCSDTYLSDATVFLTMNKSAAGVVNSLQEVANAGGHGGGGGANGSLNTISNARSNISSFPTISSENSTKHESSTHVDFFTQLEELSVQNRPPIIFLRSSGNPFDIKSYNTNTTRNLSGFSVAYEIYGILDTEHFISSNPDSSASTFEVKLDKVYGNTKGFYDKTTGEFFKCWNEYSYLEANNDADNQFAFLIISNVETGDKSSLYPDSRVVAAGGRNGKQSRPVVNSGRIINNGSYEETLNNLCGCNRGSAFYDSFKEKTVIERLVPLQRDRISSSTELIKLPSGDSKFLFPGCRSSVFLPKSSDIEELEPCVAIAAGYHPTALTETYPELKKQIDNCTEEFSSSTQASTGEDISTTFIRATTTTNDDGDDDNHLLIYGGIVGGVLFIVVLVIVAIVSVVYATKKK